MIKKKFIDEYISNQVLMLGVYYKHHAPGGMAAVIQYYERYFSVLHYICTWRDGNKLIKLYYFISAYLKCIVNFCTKPEIKIVHIHIAADASFWRKSFFVKLSKAFHKKVIVHVHASRFKDFYNESDKKQQIVGNLNLADVLIVLSQSWKEWFLDIGMPESKIIVLNNIVDYPKLEKNIQPLPDRKIHILFLGEIGHRKGIFDILCALTQNKDLYQGKIVFKIGGNKMEKELQSYIHENGLQEFVYFKGWVGGDKKIQLLNWADVFILPSFNEGLPISILEAMSYGCAIISTPVGGILEILHNKENGLVVQPGNIEMIGNAIRQMIVSPEKVVEMGEKSQQLVLPFLPNNVFIKLNNIYKALINEVN